MNTLRQLRNFWLPCVTTIVLACASNAVAQTSYKVTDSRWRRSDAILWVRCGVAQARVQRDARNFVLPEKILFRSGTTLLSVVCVNRFRAIFHTRLETGKDRSFATECLRTLKAKQ
ncbi:MAG TPA: hypothetical protein VGF82_18425 [Terracidiphilus sp.]|jgi:hypothetical protein